MDDLLKNIAESLDVIRQRWQGSPRIGIILGTGLGKLTEMLTQPTRIPFAEIPHFQTPSAPSHQGQFVCGRITGCDLVIQQGRLHAYEGYSLQQLTYSVRVMKALGIKLLIVTSASGGMHPLHQPGQLMLIDDHINLMGDNPLIGFNDDRLGPRFPDMSEPYDRVLRERLLKIAQKKQIPIQRGVYVAVKGPNYETRAEYRFFHAIGGDAVGMSTVPEVLVAVHGGMRVLGITTITNVCLPDNLQPVTSDDVVDVAHRAAKQMQILIKEFVEQSARDLQQQLFP